MTAKVKVVICAASAGIPIVITRFLPTKDNLRRKEIDREVRAIMRRMIEKREMAMKMGEAHNDDLVGLLMEFNFKESQYQWNSKSMTIEDVFNMIDECRLF